MKLLSKIFSSKYGWILFLPALAAINYLATIIHFRFDLTEEKRYSLTGTTKRIISGLEDEVEIIVFLKGDFPAGFKKLAKSTEEFLQLLKDRNGSKIHYRFISPYEKTSDGKLWGDSLVGMGAQNIDLTVRVKEGQSRNIIFPVALIQYKGKQSLVSLYPGASGRISQEEINNAEALMEYQFAKALDKIAHPQKPGIAYSFGNGEPTDGRVYDLQEALSKDYRFGLLNLNKEPFVPQGVDVLLIVKPSITFSEEEKFKLDQFVMRGGKLLCFIDNLYAEQDSLAFKPETIAFDRNLNLTDLLFRYGLRINTDLVMDLQCDMIPFQVGGTQENPQFEFLHWNYFPLLSPAENQSVNKNLGYVASLFANSLDTIKVADIKKTPLLVSSPNSRIISTPAMISLNENKNVPEDEKFKLNAIPVAMLLEGRFSSLYKNRVSKAQNDSLAAHGAVFSGESPDNKIIVVADGDIVLNNVIPGNDDRRSPQPLPMGWNRYTYNEYLSQTEYGKLFIPVANREFLLNCVEYLVNDPAIGSIRNKEIVLRLLDAKKVREQKLMWQLVNIALPVLLIILCGWIYQQIRKRKYAA